MHTANLQKGEYDYKVILRMIERKEYQCAYVSTSLGVSCPLIGISKDQLEFMKKQLSFNGLSAIISGSRVVGPRIIQRTFHPALAYLQLVSHRRAGSATYPKKTGIQIYKTKIKELGVDSVYSSDLSVLLVDRNKRGRNERGILAVALEKEFYGLGCNFPVRVFSELEGKIFNNECEYIKYGIERFIIPTLPSGIMFKESELRLAFRSTFALI